MERAILHRSWVMTADAHATLERPHEAGKIVVPVTGRPAGWCA